MSFFKEMQSRKIQKKANNFIKSLDSKSAKEVEQAYLDNKEFDNIKCANVKTIDDLSKYSFIINTFPNILEVENVKEEGIELFIKLTDDINKKNYEETKKAEDVFSQNFTTFHIA